MKSTIAKLFLVAFALTLVFTSCFKDDLLKEIDALKDTVSAMQRRNDSLSFFINAKADSLGKALTAAQKRSDSLASVLKTKSDSLSIALGITNSNLSALTKSVDSIKVQVGNINGQLTQLNIQLTSVTSQLTQLNQQFGALGADYAALNAKYQELSATLQGLNTQIAALQGEQLKLLERLNAILLQLNPPVDITTGLVAYYPFNGNAGDSSGNGNHGSVNGAVLTMGKNGVNNNAYAFNGVNNTIDLPNPFLNGTQNNKFTFSTRVNAISTANYPNIWGKTYFWGEVNFVINADNSLTFVWANSFSGNKYSVMTSIPNVISSGQWYDITFVFENSKGIFYVNGSPVQTNHSWSAQGGAVLSTTQVESVCNFIQDANTSKFGARFISGSITSFLNGSIDFFRVYNRALTQSEITYLATH